MARRQLTIDNEVAAELAGSGDSVLRSLEDRLDCDVYLRGNVITLDGPDDSVSEGQGLVEELVGLIERGHGLEPETIAAVDGATKAGVPPAEMLGDSVWRHRGTNITARTPNQKHYVDSIREHTVTFGIGPAGTGKTFLAVAMAVAALESRTSAGSSSPVPPSRPASGSGSCPVTSRRRSIPTCGRSSTRSTTCSIRIASTTTSSAGSSRWLRWRS